MKRLPFDSLALAVCVQEAVSQTLNGKVQRIVLVGETEMAISIYNVRMEKWLLVSWDAKFARFHLLPAKPTKTASASSFVLETRRRIEGARLRSIRQSGLDRIVELEFEGAEGEWRLILELMGKHANVLLVDRNATIVACAKPIGPSKSKRIVLPGKPYEPPPLPPRKSILDCLSWDEAAESDAGSPTLLKILQADTLVWDKAKSRLRQRLTEGSYGYVAEGAGAYPIDPSSAGWPSIKVESFSGAVAERIGVASNLERAESAKRTLVAQLERVELSRRAAIHDLEQIADAAKQADRLQWQANRILSSLHAIQPGQSVLETWDDEGQTVAIPLSPTLTGLENAERLFNKAKRAKLRSLDVEERLASMRAELGEVLSAMSRLQDEENVAAIAGIESLAKERRWLHQASAVVSDPKKGPDPLQGWKIRRTEVVGGWVVLYGENATSNDHLTHRIAKPNDLWLHVRGATSAHVVLQTGNQPNRVQPDALRQAAKIAVRNSASKHSKYVPVDYTLKKYVRKPRGAAAGTAVYTHEKTLHVEMD